MKILWISNVPVANQLRMLNRENKSSGGWIETSYNAMSNVEGVHIGVATVANVPNLLHEHISNSDFYIVPFSKALKYYRPYDVENLHFWKIIIDDFKPDLIHIWGTEFSHALSVLQVSKGIPSVVYIQGMVSQISNHFLDGLGFCARFLTYSFSDLIFRKGIMHSQKDYISKRKVEEKILVTSNNCIVESEWCANNCKIIAHDCNVYKSLLPINPIYSTKRWNIDRVKRHSILTVAGGYPIKGHHFLIETIRIIKKYYPDIIVYVPGADYYHCNTIKDKLLASGYNRYVSSLINKYDLTDNFHFTGFLKPEEMAEYMQTTNVFVMPSSCENHSSSLIEAMMVGMPSISTYVGGISNYLKDGENGFLCRFGEPETMAELVMNIFESDELACKISENSVNDTRCMRQSIDIKSDFLKVYEDVLKDKR